MTVEDSRSGSERRSEKDRRSGVDTRSKEEKSRSRARMVPRRNDHSSCVPILSEQPVAWLASRTC
jgi:hypothetical protein